MPSQDHVDAAGDSVRPARRGRRIWRLAGLVAAVLLAAVTAILISGWAGLGQLPSGAQLTRLQRLPGWRDGAFVNAQRIWADGSAIWWREVFGPAVPDAQPDTPVAVVHDDRWHFATPAPSGLRITWFGHSSALVEIDGATILIDPLWSERPSPVTWAGPKRWYAPPAAIRDLPRIDAVLISHDHYDHLDRATIVALKASAATFVVPVGIGSHLAYWGIPRDRIVELDWWQSAHVGTVDLVATPARHTSGRISLTSNQTLWAGFAMIGLRHRVWYSGDTGFHTGLAEIGRRYGPFDATLIEAGQYDPLWPDNHLGPELAVEANQLARGRTMMPVHWGLVSLAPQGWTEPVERVIVAARCAGVRLVVPRPGESVEPSRPFTVRRWWPARAWQSADRKPVRGTVNGDPAHRVAVPACSR